MLLMTKMPKYWENKISCSKYTFLDNISFSDKFSCFVHEADWAELTHQQKYLHHNPDNQTIVNISANIYLSLNGYNKSWLIRWQNTQIYSVSQKKDFNRNSREQERIDIRRRLENTTATISIDFLLFRKLFD